MARDPDLEPPPLQIMSAEAGKADKQASQEGAREPEAGYGGEVDSRYWLACLEDAERVEREWRERAREIIQIYRNETRSSRSGKLSAGPVTFNILFSNSEVMLPAVYSKPPKPVVRSRFTKVSEPPLSMGMMGPPPGMPPPGMPVADPLGQPVPLLGMPPPPMLTPPGPGLPMPPEAAGLAGALPPMPPPPGPPLGGPLSTLDGIAPPEVAAPFPPVGSPAGPPGLLPGMPRAAPGRPRQQDIETAASILEKTLEQVVDDEHSNEAVKMALKDVLLAGRGCCRVRWRPKMVKQPVMAGDDVTPLPEMGIPGEPPPMEEVKVWESVDDEYVYWEDLLVDPVRHARDTNWVAFRHLFTREALEGEFSDAPAVQELMQQGKLSELLRWTDESAAKSPVGGGSPMKSASQLGDHVKKAMVWEIWDRVERRIIWFCREASGMVLRIDPDSYQLQGFFPIPVPMLAVTTTDSRIPRPYYDIYARLAADLDETSKRISDLTRHVKMTGAYNGASPEIRDLLLAGDGKMIPVDGVDLFTGGLDHHIWMKPIDPAVKALNELYVARDQLRQSIYEVMGISDIMRGATKASETATAQRIKGSMGISRLEDQKQQAGNFVRDLLRLKGEIIAQNFDASTLETMTGEEVTPEVLAILRSDFQRTCAIDIEADSTVVVDEQAEQEGMAQVAQTIQLTMQGAAGMLQTGLFPPDMVMNLALEMTKMFLHPVRYSRNVVEMINDYQEKLEQQAMMAALMPPPPPMMGPPGAPPGAPPMGPSGPAPPPPSGPGAGPPKPNGAGMPPPPQGPNAGMSPPPML